MRHIPATVLTLSIETFVRTALSSVRFDVIVLPAILSLCGSRTERDEVISKLKEMICPGGVAIVSDIVDRDAAHYFVGDQFPMPIFQSVGDILSMFTGWEVAVACVDRVGLVDRASVVVRRAMSGQRPATS